MKSKAHYKKCMELGIVPVPTVVDDSYIDEECLTRQVNSISGSADKEIFFLCTHVYVWGEVFTCMCVCVCPTTLF
jgi:hypothetical protein